MVHSVVRLRPAGRLLEALHDCTSPDRKSGLTVFDESFSKPMVLFWKVRFPGAST